ncbi:hypothetical protein Tco_1369605 [Tanacetum coccineum]
MPLSNKTILDSHCFVHELKREMNDDLEYVNSLEKELDELESEKADFSNIYDLLLEECVSKDVTCSYLHSLSESNAHTELKCMYLHKVKECECLALKLSKRTESVNKEVHNNLIAQIRKQAVRDNQCDCTLGGAWPLWNCPKHVSHQSPREKVGSNDMVHNYYLEKAKKSAQLQKDKEVNGKPSMIDPARLPNTANGNKTFLKFNELQCPTCKKCLYSANHDECVLEYLSRLNPRASAQNKDAKSHKTTKRYMPVAKSSASKKPERQIPTGHRFSNKKTTTVPEKTMTPRSCLSWKPTGRIFKTIGLRWVPTGKIFAFSTNKVNSEPAHGSIVDIPHIHACKQTLGLSAADQASVFMAMMSVHISSGLVLHQMTSDHNRSELGIQDHSNEQSSSKLVPKVVP